VNLSAAIQAQNITATVTSNFATLTVNVPDAKGWTWTVIWDGAVQRTGIKSFPYQSNVAWSANKTIQLNATDSAGNYGYSTMFTPTVLAPPAPQPIDLSPTIQAQNITATLTSDFSTLTVNVPDAKGWTWSVIWDNAARRTGITSFPFQASVGWSGNKTIQLYATNSAGNWGYSTQFNPTVLAPPVPIAPQISVVSINKTSLAPGESLRVEYRITDDGQCCNPHDVYMYDAAGAWVTRVQGTRISGTSQNGVWAANITVPVNSQGQNQGRPLTAGTYTFRTQTTDAQNNFSDLVLLGSVSVVVSAPTPTPTLSPTPVPIAPQIAVVSINKTSLAPGETLRVEYRITDDGQCCNPHDVYMYDAAGAWVTRVQGTRISGTSQNGVWAANITVPVNSQGQNQGRALTAGTYTFRTQTTDAQNNYSDLVLLGSVSVVVPTPDPIFLSPVIQAQAITATVTPNFGTLTVNVPDARGWTWSVIWDGATQRINIRSFPFQTAVGWTANKTIQLYATNAAGNWGYSTQFTPAVLDPTLSTPTSSPGVPSVGGQQVPTPTASATVSPSPSTSPTSSPAVAENQPPVANPPGPAEVTSPAVTSVQRALSAFTAVILNAAQKEVVEQLLDDAPNSERLICTAIRFAGNSAAANLRLRKQAKAVCDFAKSQNPELSVWVQSKPTTARSFAGRVLLVARG
jgi:hypothetical protein